MEILDEDLGAVYIYYCHSSILPRSLQIELRQLISLLYGWPASASEGDFGRA